jgi:hypothetical protein
MFLSVSNIKRTYPGLVCFVSMVMTALFDLAREISDISVEMQQV